MAKKKRRVRVKKPQSIGLKINDMINTTNGRERFILMELKVLNNIAYTKYFLGPGKILKSKYKDLQKDPIWIQAKVLLWEYFKIKGDGLCSHCQREINLTDSALHHIQYNWQEIYNPQWIRFLHNACHRQVHIIKRNSIKKYRKRR